MPNLKIKYGSISTNKTFADLKQGEIFLTGDTNSVFIKVTESTNTIGASVNLGNGKVVNFHKNTVITAVDAELIVKEIN